jgi:rhodanese-related sulfurtransferase
MSNLPPAVLAERLNTVNAPHLLDVREPEEHAIAALPGSTLIPLGELSMRTDEISSWKDEEIVVYCHHGVRSLHAIALLGSMGFNKLLNLSGGIDRWSKDVDPGTPRY